MKGTFKVNPKSQLSYWIRWDPEVQGWDLISVLKEEVWTPFGYGDVLSRRYLNKKIRNLPCGRKRPLKEYEGSGKREG